MRIGVRFRLEFKNSLNATPNALNFHLVVLKVALHLKYDVLYLFEKT